MWRRLLKRHTNSRQYPLWVSQNIVVPEMQYPEPLLFEPPITDGIRSASVMLATISLDDQPDAKVHEIDDIGAKRLLTPEFLPIQSMGTEMPPEQLFGVRHILSQVLGELALIHPPLPNPSPARGEG